MTDDEAIEGLVIDPPVPEEDLARIRAQVAAYRVTRTSTQQQPYDDS